MFDAPKARACSQVALRRRVGAIRVAAAALSANAFAADLTLSKTRCVVVTLGAPPRLLEANQLPRALERIFAVIELTSILDAHE